MIFPLFWLVSTSFRPLTELNLVPPPLLPIKWTVNNYVTVFNKAPMMLYFWNSLVFATVSTLFIVLTSTVAGYIFGKFRFPGNNLLFVLVLATAIVPFEVYMVPLFLQMNALKLVNTGVGLILPFLVLSYGIFFMRQNTITSVPDELLDAARIDGMSESGIMLRLVPRLLAPAISALAILAFIQAWTAFIWPLLILNEPKLFPMELGLSQFANSLVSQLRGDERGRGDRHAADPARVPRPASADRRRDHPHRPEGLGGDGPDPALEPAVRTRRLILEGR